MRAGTLDRKVTIQRVQRTQSPSGDVQESWQTIASNRWAQIKPISGSEQLGGEQLRAQHQVDIRLRWSSDIADISPLDRIVFPASAATDSPSMSSAFYDILWINELKRHDELQVIAIHRSDVP